MKLLTKKIEDLARKQEKKVFVDDLGIEKLKVVAKFFDAMGNWRWYMLSLSDDLDTAYCLVSGFALEFGSVSLNELRSIKGFLGVPRIERDTSFIPTNAKEIYDHERATRKDRGFQC